MNPLRSLCILACLLAAVVGSPNQMRSNSLNNKLSPTQWLSISELEQLPAMDKINLQQLERLTPEQGAALIDRLYHVYQLNDDLEPTFVPSPSDIPAYIVNPNGQKIITELSQLVNKCKQLSNFGDEEVTVIITGLPMELPSVDLAVKKLVQSYMQRYRVQEQRVRISTSEEDLSQTARKSGDIIVIDLGSILTSFKRIVMLDTEKTGAMIAKELVQLTNELNVPQEVIHVIGIYTGAQVAGGVGRNYARLTGHKLRRITGLDPSKLFSRNRNVLAGLARGVADFVDVIHTSACGMGTPIRSGDVDFYPNGPCATVPGADNVIEASMRATRYFAESVRPGNERNFPAVAASSLQQYKNKNGNGPRTYMGIDADFDVEGDYILQVNSKSPFGKNTPAQKQTTYHGAHQAWRRNMNNQFDA